MQTKFLLKTSLFIFSLFIFSCNNENRCYKDISNDYLKSLLTEDAYFVDIIIPLQQNKFAVVNRTLLIQVYKQHYEAIFPCEFDFLKAVYDSSIQDIHIYFQDDLMIDTDISIIKEYNDNGLQYIIDKYLRNIGNGNYTFKEFINYTVVKIMFCNNYYLYQNDYIPTYLFKVELERFIMPESP